MVSRERLSHDLSARLVGTSSESLDHASFRTHEQESWARPVSLMPTQYPLSSLIFSKKERRGKDRVRLFAANPSARNCWQNAVQNTFLFWAERNRERTFGVREVFPMFVNRAKCSKPGFPVRNLSTTHASIRDHLHKLFECPHVPARIPLERPGRAGQDMAATKPACHIFPGALEKCAQLEQALAIIAQKREVPGNGCLQPNQAPGIIANFEEAGGSGARHARSVRNEDNSPTSLFCQRAKEQHNVEKYVNALRFVDISGSPPCRTVSKTHPTYCCY